MEQIRPREQGGQYACWIKGRQRESEATSYEWAHWRASARHAAQAFADDLSDHGTHPDLVGRDFEICVRDKVDGALAVFTVGWAHEPMPFVSGERVEVHGARVAYG